MWLQTNETRDEIFKQRSRIRLGKKKKKRESVEED